MKETFLAERIITGYPGHVVTRLADTRTCRSCAHTWPSLRTCSHICSPPRTCRSCRARCTCHPPSPGCRDTRRPGGHSGQSSHRSKPEQRTGGHGGLSQSSSYLGTSGPVGVDGAGSVTVSTRVSGPAETLTSPGVTPERERLQITTLNQSLID